ITRSLEEDFKMPKIDVPTRWNSTYLMLQRFKEIKIITDILVTKHQNLQDIYLTYAEHNILQDTMDILHPINDATELLSGSAYPTLGDVRIVMMSLLAHLDRNSIESVNSQVEIARTIKTKLEVYWPLLRESSIIATLLDPRTKLSAFIHDDQSHARFILQKVYDEYNPDNIQISPFRLITVRSTFRAIIQTDHINPLEWWKLHSDNYPTLVHLAQNYLAIPASSVPSELTFSIAKHTVSAVRNRIDGETARTSLCLKSWITNESFFNS
ncbi:2504_t:CDS:2, partial [Ambispora gerdemannii]